MIFVSSYFNEDNDKISIIYESKIDEYVVVLKTKKEMKYVIFSTLKVAIEYAEDWTIKNE